MKSRLFIAAVLFLFFCGTMAAQTKLVEKVTRKGDELVIPYEKYVLSNGLTLIIHEDHSDPVAHVDVTYHVGSAREEIGKSGFAHFFEHMMFQGSDHVGDEQHFKIVTESGGTLNHKLLPPIFDIFVLSTIFTQDSLSGVSNLFPLLLSF